MLPHIIVDIATLPTGGLNLFNLYVALSHSSGQATIHLLYDFDIKVFQALHSAKLLAEDGQLQELDMETNTNIH